MADPTIPLTAWQRNGTKIIGYTSLALGVLATLDQATVGLIESVLGPKYGPYFGKCCLIAAGVLVAMRGHKNTQDIAQAVVEKTAPLVPKPGDLPK